MRWLVVVGRLPRCAPALGRAGAVRSGLRCRPSVCSIAVRFFDIVAHIGNCERVSRLCAARRVSSGFIVFYRSPTRDCPVEFWRRLHMPCLLRCV